MTDDGETSNSEMMQKQFACHFCHPVISKALQHILKHFGRVTRFKQTAATQISWLCSKTLVDESKC